MDPTKSRYSPFNLRSKQCSVTIRSAEHRIQGGVKFGQLKGSSSRYSLLEGVVGVKVLEFVVFDTEDSEVEGILGADGDISEEESRILEMFSTG